MQRYSVGNVIEIKDRETGKVFLKIRITGVVYSKSCQDYFYNIVKIELDSNGKEIARTNLNYSQMELMKLQVVSI